MDLGDLPEPLPEWLRDNIEQSLRDEIRAAADSRRKAVERGAELPELAATLLDKFGWGVAKATAIIGLNADLQPEIDALVRGICPDFEQLTRRRWEARPAGLSLEQPA